MRRFRRHSSEDTSSDEHAGGAGHPGQTLHRGSRAGEAEGGDAGQGLGVHQTDAVVQVGHQQVVCGERVPLQGRDGILLVRALEGLWPQDVLLVLGACGREDDSGYFPVKTSERAEMNITVGFR